MNEDIKGTIPHELKQELLATFITAVEKCRSLGFHPYVSFNRKLAEPVKKIIGNKEYTQTHEPCLVILTEDVNLGFIPLNSVPSKKEAL